MVNLYHFVAGFLVFTLVITGGVMFINDMETNYPGSNMTDDDFGEVYDTINDTFDISQDMKGDAGDVGSSESTLDTILNTITLGGYKALKRTWGMFSVLGKILTAVQTKLGLPEWLVKIALTMVSLAITFTIVLLMMRVTSQ